MRVSTLSGVVIAGGIAGGRLRGGQAGQRQHGADREQGQRSEDIRHGFSFVVWECIARSLLWGYIAQVYTKETA